ncbi:M20 aminoacylase family protein [Pseudorhodoplanes sinuspersici]|uniref:Amidohydrolase n=1 Tax=Pseudorhodoplanes sinuspersici TaxID=1235591 RepID=A0A1W6ZWJ4_9HYPH|nr:M20 aminoacylase family protein [Pseudorhodoplanes sinuspersici]ARQ01757.1 amidohydrolase [Pseudorhodoplanes sinuspersici]RKE73503.1 hippurate hydrolase [Pseudorhodoplanes sinuspersici]
MPIVNRIAEFHPEITAWRRDIHANPELLFDVHRTAASVAEKLKAFGCDEVVPGIGRTGVVGVIKGNKPASGGRASVIGLRADMDALPIEEATGLAYKSTIKGKMHACGHDGHTAMLLGAAKYLAETRNFGGTAVVIFQPAEEGGGGGKEMVADGMMDRFGIEEVYGMHNYPGMPVGQFGMRAGPMMAAADYVSIEIEGKGAHAARPHLGIDPILVGAQMVNQLQSIVSRNVDPLESGVVSICVFQAGTTNNVIPQTAKLAGTIRSLTDEVRDLLEKRVREVVEGVARLHGATARVSYHRGYPVTRNHADQTAFAASVASEVAGKDRVNDELPPMMGAEDFSYMLNARPGAFIFVGNGDSAGLHHPAYDFNDDVIPIGSSYWVKLVEKALPA